ncbi:MAG: 4-phosphoerythronate dehydrogenase [Gammaproteobacteria bacterium]|nr:4-phosphoerythronate dehydrogenase [Gammaproteobacteria bacterium]
MSKKNVEVNSGLNIVADENIPYVAEVFGALGKVRTVTGRALSADQVSDADMLLVRSVSRVDQSLLQNSRVKFVATATIGTDHVDLSYLKSHNMGFASAPGSNAISAAEYVLSSLCAIYTLDTLRNKTVAVVGCGNVGSRVLHRLELLGIKTLPYDPPRQEQFNDRDYVTWDAVKGADIVTAHVPLNRTGSHPTLHMFDHAFFTERPSHSVFINTARGSAVDEAALKRVLQSGKQLILVLDVWHGEPAIDRDIVDYARVATPHIAGYSLDGKVRGTRMIFEAACDYFQIPYHWSDPHLAVPEATQEISFPPEISAQDLISQAVLHAYPVMQDDAALRAGMYMDADAWVAHFDRLRKQYPVRREFSYFTVLLQKNQMPEANLLSVRERLQGLGFTVKLT